MAKLTSGERNALDAHAFAFPAERKEPLENAAHVRNAVARFDQVAGVSDVERDSAWARILAAATAHGVSIPETDWRDLPVHAGRHSK
jgi:hypothetical protein